MEVKTKMRYGVTRRKCNQIRKQCPKIERNASLKKVSNILRKKESLRSAEENAVLASMSDEVKEVKFRIRQRQKIIERIKEVEDESLILRNKCKKLAYALQHAKHLVVYTGAGISTAADIPDYRGPNGIWTLLQQGKKIGKHDLTRADPTLTHMALWQLYRKRFLKFVVSQNCDGLHLRSGLPRRALSEVHGNMYVEMCRECKPNVQYWRLFDTTEKTARFYHNTGRICHKCGSALSDSIVHFGEKGIAQWPLNWPGALHHAAKADVILCLGSSLKVLKKYPWLWQMDRPPKQRPTIFIVNLQWTPKDSVAALKINGKCDTVMQLVMEFLGLETPKYERYADPIFAHTSHLNPKELHTTTQPMLIRLPPSKSLNEDKESKQKEVEDPDEDCPLNILKMKMNVGDEEPEDLSLSALKIEDVKVEQCEETIDKTDSILCETVCDFSLDKSILKTEMSESKIECKEQVDLNECENRVRQGNESSISLKMQTADFSCTVDVEERKDVKFDDTKEKKLSNLTINAVINANVNLKSDSNGDVVNKCDKLSPVLEGISMEILAEEFERVHVEMKTNENEIRQVSILLINKSKLSPLKCDKFQQTDPVSPEVKTENVEVVKEVKSEVKFLDTGQKIEEISTEMNNQNTSEKMCDASNTSEKMCDASNTSEKMCDASNTSEKMCDASNTSEKMCDASKVMDIHIEAEVPPVFMNGNSHSPFGTLDSMSKSSSEFSSVQQNSISLEMENSDTSRPSSSLRNFRRIKDKCPSVTSESSDTLTASGKSMDCTKINGVPKFEEKVKNEGLSEKALEPIDYSLKCRTVSRYINKIPNLAQKISKIPFILKVPKPTFLSSRILKAKSCDSKTKGVLDLSLKSENNDCLKNVSRVNTRRNQPNINSCSNIGLTSEGENSVVEFQKKCQSMARTIIQNTLSVNHHELQYAYSGIHSIINPKPFYVQYDFKNLFNSLNFIRFAQKLMSKTKGNLRIMRQSKIVCKTRLQATQRRILTRKKEPQCKFCFENYKSYICNFYASYNSEDRFEKWRNDKLVMCACCDESESDDGSEEENSASDKEEDVDSDDKPLQIKCNNDLKKRVQISVSDDKGSEEKADPVQAGWFGKGFRKNRRRKR